ncbi:hypothetical protein QQS21_001187 [Conoideocrella luteorostrata]|uniref:Uncharacterized protein n=1 Tax=Conoideocrella luteorostrata TaxID=1105319 RepID=A0AAJ0G3I6_9HYPO|nr:hypothetical protein QQS21_001187 [Conoideocrella luteorostrata]
MPEKDNQQAGQGQGQGQAAGNGSVKSSSAGESFAMDRFQKEKDGPWHQPLGLGTPSTFGSSNGKTNSNASPPPTAHQGSAAGRP